MVDISVIRNFLLETGNSSVADNVTLILNMLDNAGIKDYIEDLEKWTDVDETNIDPINKYDAIINIAKKYGIKLIRRRGVVIDEDRINEISTQFIVAILLALDGLQNLDIQSALYITGILTDENTNNDLDKLYLILFYLNPSLDSNSFSTYVKDVSPVLFDKLEHVCENIINSEDIIPDDIDNNLTDISIKLVDEFIKLGFKSVPDILLTIINYPTIVLAIRNNYQNEQSKILKKINFLLTELKDEDNIFDTPIYSNILYSIVDLFIIGYIGDNTLKDDRDELLTLISDHKYSKEITDLVNKIYDDFINSEFLKTLDKIIKLVNESEELDNEQN